MQIANRNISRRIVLKGLGALLSLAIIKPDLKEVIEFLEKKDRDVLYKQIKSNSIISNQYFYLDKPITIKNSIKNLVFIHCYFLCNFSLAKYYPVIAEGYVEKVAFINNIFKEYANSK